MKVEWNNKHTVLSLYDSKNKRFGIWRATKPTSVLESVGIGGHPSDAQHSDGKGHSLAVSHSKHTGYFTETPGYTKEARARNMKSAHLDTWGLVGSLGSHFSLKETEGYKILGTCPPKTQSQEKESAVGSQRTRAQNTSESAGVSQFFSELTTARHGFSARLTGQNGGEWGGGQGWGLSKM